MRNNIARLLLFGIIGSACYAADPPGDPPRTRRQFARAMDQVKEGMSQAEVLALLGQPDDKRTEHDAGGISTTGTKEIWRYGTLGHLTTATLGQVYLDDQGRVQYVFGQGKPPPDDLLEERQLRRLLDVLGQVPSYNAGSHYNPLTVIRAVNLLQPLGKDKALAVIDEFLRVVSRYHEGSGEGVFPVLRTLFDIPEEPGYMPTMGVGAPRPSQPQDRKLLPRFPIALEQDIPFLVVSGYTLGGFPEQPESHVAHFRSHGRLRARPLAPPDAPFQVLQAFAKSPRWLFGERGGILDDERGWHLVGDQVLRLLDSVYRVEPDRYGSLMPWGRGQAARRQKVIEEVSALKVRWDAKRSRYTFLDGTCLPEAEPKRYRREVWKPEVVGLEVRFILERQSARYVSLELVEKYEAGKPRPPVVFKVFRVGAKDKPIAEFRTGQGLANFAQAVTRVDAGTRGTSSSGKTVELAEGSEIQVEMAAKDKSLTSPIYKP